MTAAISVKMPFSAVTTLQPESCVASACFRLCLHHASAPSLWIVSSTNNGAEVRALCWNNETTVPRPLSLKQTCLSDREIQLAVDRICLRRLNPTTAPLSEPFTATLGWLMSCHWTWTFTWSVVCYLAEIRLLVSQFYRGASVLLE